MLNRLETGVGCDGRERAKWAGPDPGRGGDRGGSELGNGMVFGDEGLKEERRVVVIG